MDNDKNSVLANHELKHFLCMGTIKIVCPVSFRSLISCSAKDKVPGSVVSDVTHSTVSSISSSSVTLVPESHRRYDLFRCNAFQMLKLDVWRN